MDKKEFDYIVVGNEPAGLWLLEALADFPGQPFHLGWIQDENRPVSVTLPLKMAQDFKIPLSSVWSPEIILPKRTIAWSRASLRAHFPEINLGEIENTLTKDTYRATQLVRKALRLRPDFLALAEAVWKWGGRSPGNSVEMSVLGALQFLETGWWDPMCQVPSDISIWQTGAFNNPIEQIKKSGRGTILQFRGLDPIVSRCVVLNLPGGRLARYLRLIPPAQWPIDSESTRVKTRLYRLGLTLDPNSIPATITPLCVVLDSDEIPDPATEMWPITFSPGPESSEISAWATAPQEFVLEDVGKRLREAMKRVNRLFPLLSRMLRQIEGPLDMETCHDEPIRDRAIRELEESAVESYESTLLSTRTRLDKVFYLGPNVNSHFSYPAGPLKGAEKILLDIVGKRKRALVSKNEVTV